MLKRWRLAVIFFCAFFINSSAVFATACYLGPVGTYTEEAASQYFGNREKLEAVDSVEKALSAVEAGQCTYAVIPQENTIGGPVYPYVDALLEHRSLSVLGAIDLPIRQALLVYPGTKLSDIRAVLSHPQGLIQSRSWRQRYLPDAKPVEVSSTAEGARQVAAGQKPSVAAIGPEGAGIYYHLAVLAKDIQENSKNVTRFYVLGRSQAYPSREGHVIVVACGKANDLPALLNGLVAMGGRVCSLHDRPLGSSLGEYQYILEVSQCNPVVLQQEKKTIAGRMELEIRGFFQQRAESL